MLLIHEGGRQRPGDGNAADPNACADFAGPIAAIVEKLTTDIQVIVSGHSPSSTTAASADAS